MYQTALRHPAYDGFWRSISTREQSAKIKIPAYVVGGWYDNFVESDLEGFAALHRRSGVHRLMIGPWAHDMRMKFAEADFGPDAIVPLRGVQFQWFDQWLKGKDTPLLSAPPVRIFVMGANRWREEREWPLTRAELTPYYLASKGQANSLRGNGGLAARPPRHAPPDRYVYDPRNPVPTRGGAVCCNPKVFQWGPMDQRGLEGRGDVLVYTSPPLKRDLEVTGHIRVVLYASTTARDTDFTAKLVDVFPDGQARNLTRRHPAPALPRVAREARAGNAGRGLQADARGRRHQQRLPQGPPHPPGNFEQQLPALRPQPQYRPRHRGRNRTPQGHADRLSRPRAPLAHPAAGHPLSV